MAQKVCELLQNAYSREVKQVAYSSGMVVIKDNSQDPKQIAELFFRLPIYFPIACIHPGLNNITLCSHPLKGSLSVNCKGLSEI